MRYRADREYLAVVLSGVNRAAMILAQSRLDGAGIRSFIRHDIVQDFFGLGRIGIGFNFVVGPTELVVAAEDYAVARTLLEGIELMEWQPPPLYLRVLAGVLLAEYIGGMVSTITGLV